MVRFQTFLHSGFFVIIPLVKFPTAFVAYVFLFGRIVYHMIGRTAVLADTPAGHPCHQVFIRHADVDGGGQGDPPDPSGSGPAQLPVLWYGETRPG